jgi:hypothetical protein
VKLLLILALLVGAGLGVVSRGTPAQAQAVRTWVSGVGDDANPCSRTAPCKTFAGAISKTQTNGIIEALDPGGFGAVTITKSITIEGVGGGAAGVSAPTTNGIIINAAAGSIVTLRNLQLEGSGTGLNGVNFLGGGALHLDNVHIHDFRGNPGNGIRVAPLAMNVELFVSNSQITDNAGGVHLNPGAGRTVKASFETVVINNNTAFGLKADDRATANIERSTVAGNGNSGIAAVADDASPGAAMIFVSHCAIAGNGLGGVVTVGAQASAFINNNVIVANNTGVIEGAGNISTFVNNVIAGNTPGGNVSGSLSPVGLQ